MKKTAFFALTLIAVVLFAGCAGDEEKPAAEAVQEVEDVNYRDVLNEWRKDVTRGEGGSFALTMGDEEFTTEWGYADFRVFPGGLKSKVLLLSNPAKGEGLPIIRVAVTSEYGAIEDFIGKELPAETINFKNEEGKGTGLKGAGHMTITAIEDGYVVGTFSGTIEDKKIEGSFKAKLNIAE